MTETKSRLPCTECLTRTLTEVHTTVSVELNGVNHLLENIATLKCTTCGNECYSTPQAEQLRKRIDELKISLMGESLTDAELAQRKARLHRGVCPGCESPNARKMGAWNPTLECPDCKGYFVPPDGRRSSIYK